MKTINPIFRILNSLKNAFKLLWNGHYSILYSEFKKRLYSQSLSFGLQRDLNKPFEAVPAKIEIHVRVLENNDLEKLFEETEAAMVNPRIVAHQKAMVDANIPTCYVAVTSDDDPCYMQWLIGYKDNDKIKSKLEGAFPPLNVSEALLEGAYGNPKYRGLGIMGEAMAEIAEKASQMNVRWVNTFVDITNIPSLKGCRRSGFEPYLLRKDKWFLFRRSISFHSLPEKLLESYNINTREKDDSNESKFIKREKIKTELQS